MKKKIRFSIVIITLFVLEILSLTSSKNIPFVSVTQTPKPKLKPILIPLESQAGNSDGILFLGLIIFLIVAIPLILKYREIQSQK